MILLVILIYLLGLGELYIMASIDDLNTNIATLKADVEAYIAAKTGAVPAAQVDLAAQAVAAIDAEVKAAQ